MKTLHTITLALLHGNTEACFGIVNLPDVEGIQSDVIKGEAAVEGKLVESGPYQATAEAAQNFECDELTAQKALQTQLTTELDQCYRKPYHK